MFSFQFPVTFRPDVCQKSPKSPKFLLIEVGGKLNHICCGSRSQLCAGKRPKCHTDRDTCRFHWPQRRQASWWDCFTSSLVVKWWLLTCAVMLMTQECSKQHPALRFSSNVGAFANPVVVSHCVSHCSSLSYAYLVAFIPNIFLQFKSKTSRQLCESHQSSIPFRIYVPCGETMFPLCYIELIKVPQPSQGQYSLSLARSPLTLCCEAPTGLETLYNLIWTLVVPGFTR